VPTIADVKTHQFHRHPSSTSTTDERLREPESTTTIPRFPHRGFPRWIGADDGWMQSLGRTGLG
jgi:hypothetical protein